MITEHHSLSIRSGGLACCNCLRKLNPEIAFVDTSSGSSLKQAAVGPSSPSSQHGAAQVPNTVQALLAQVPNTVQALVTQLPNTVQALAALPKKVQALVSLNQLPCSIVLSMLNTIMIHVHSCANRRYDVGNLGYWSLHHVGNLGY